MLPGPGAGDPLPPMSISRVLRFSVPPSLSP